MSTYSQGIQGAAGGAMGGFATGAGPLGAVIGGGLGLLGGLFGGGGASEYENRLKAMEEEWANRGAPQAGQAERGGYSDFRGNQAALISQLEALSQGRGPSLAAQQMREAMDRSAGSQASLAAGAAGSGVGAGAALRNAANNTAAIQSQGARDTGMMRTQEQLGALNQLGLTIHGARGADESMNRFNAAQGNQMSLANLDAQLRAMGMNDAARLQAIQQAMGAAGPGMGSSILAGGAGALGQMLGQRAAGNGAQGANPYSQGGSPFGFGGSMSGSSGPGFGQTYMPQPQDPSLGGGYFGGGFGYGGYGSGYGPGQ